MTTDEESSPVSLDDLRHQIDSADRAMLEALRSRLDAVREVAARKQGSDAPIRDQRREDALQARWASLADEAGLNPHSVGRLLREVLSWSRREQESAWRPSPAQRVRVAFQGTSGAHSDLAANELMVIRGTPAMTVGKPTFEEVLQALWDGHVHYAFLPVENSIVGGITAVHTLLMEGRAHIVDEESWDVHHALSVLPGTDLSTVRTVSSHPVALRQCRRTLTETLGLTVQEVWDTAGAARAVALGADPTRAAVCSPEAAKMNGLHVLRENVSDHPENRTRFLLLAREPEPIPPGVQARTTFRLVADHQPGSLARCLGAFADHDVNLSGLVSLMLPRRPGQYGFLVDIEGHADDERVARALVGVRAAARQLTILGTYPDRTSDRKASIRRSPTAPAAEARAEAIGSGSKSTDAVPEKAATTEGAVLRNEAPAQDKSSGAPSTKTAQGTRIYALGDVRLGGDAFVLIAGPGRVQHIDELQTSAALVQRVGGALLRVDVTSSHAASSDLVSLDELVAVGRQFGLPLVTEVGQPQDVAALAEQVDVLLVGARNMQNVELLTALGRMDRPVLLKRGSSASIDDLLEAANHVRSAGNQQVVLCEHGIRTFETATPATLDLAAVPILKERTDLPVIVAPSRSAGDRSVVVPLALAAAAAGADGLIIECSVEARSPHQLGPDDLQRLTAGLHPILASRGRRLA